MVDLEDLQAMTFENAGQLGRLVGEACEQGLVIYPDQFRELVLEGFGFEDERAAWAGYHQVRCRDVCRCHGDRETENLP